MQHQLAGRKTVGKRRSLGVSGANISREGEGMRSERINLVQLGRFHLRADEFLCELQHRALIRAAVFLCHSRSSDWSAWPENPLMV